MDESGTDKNEDRFDADVALSTGLLGPLIDSLIDALGGEMTLGEAAADATPQPHVAAPSSPLTGTATATAEEADEGPPF